MSLANRIKGGLFGVAVGDALGGTTELMTRNEIRDRYGVLTDMVGGGVWNLRPGEVTDDTMMTLCVAEGILENPQDPVPAIGERFLRWFDTNPRYVGNIIRCVFILYQKDWFDAARIVHRELGRSAGNGSLMRCLPVALVYPHLHDVVRVSRLQSNMTHFDERCAEACEIYNRTAFRILQDGVGLMEAIRAEIRNTEYDDDLEKEPDCAPDGFVVNTFRWVLHVLATSRSFAEVVQKAANLGGDTDTIAAVAGGLAGVYYGYDGIPERYASRILLKERLEEVSSRICEMRRKLSAASMR